MRRRSFLMAAGAAAVSSSWKGSAQSSLGTLTWVEPDGVWIRELPDGRAAKIAAGDRLHNPRLSPSGRWISYMDHDEKQFVVRSDGKPGASFETASVVWLRGDWLAVAYEDRTEQLSPADGWKSAVTVWKSSGLPLFSANGEQFARVELHERPADQYGLNRDKTELYVASAATPGRKSKVLIPENEGGIQLYSWTREGKSLIYWRASEWSGSLWSDGVDLYSMPAAGGPERKLGVEALAHDDVLDLAPKSAGDLLAVTRSRGGRETWTEQRVAVVDFDTGSVRNLTHENVAALCPAWSPDGRNIAYTAAPDAGNIGGGDEAHDNLQQRKIWLLNPAGAAAPHPITNDPHYRDEEPQWSADGSHILFGRMDYNSHTSLWLMESDGSNARHICQVKVYDDMSEEDSWFGFYGYIDWRSAFDWRRS